ncbi:hypothetical protein ACH4A7_37960 [Streptomyces cyaneofuscatus]
MGHNPSQHAHGSLRLSLDPGAQHRDGAAASGLAENSDSGMIDNR